METDIQPQSYDSFVSRVLAHRRTDERDISTMTTLRDLFENEIEVEFAADKIASLVLQSEDVFLSYEKVLGYSSLIIGAAGSLSEEQHLVKLAQLTVALSRVLGLCIPPCPPHHIPDQLKHCEGGPGETWSERTCFSTRLCENMYGPTAYISDGFLDHEAEQKWRDENTFFAYLIHESSKSNDTGKFHYLFHYAFRSIIDSLEDDPLTEKGMDALLSLSSACQWIKIAGSELWAETLTGDVGVPVGPLGFDEYATGDVNRARWMFWSQRLYQLAETNMITEDLRLEANLAAMRIDSFLTHQGNGPL